MCGSGVWLFQLRYIYSKSFRLREEQIAYAAEIRQLVYYQLRIRRVHLAMAMSGSGYRVLFRNMVGYEEALRWVQETVRTAEVEFFAECMAGEDGSAERGEVIVTSDTNTRKIEATKPRSVFLDRIALVCTALVCFVVVELLVMGIALLTSGLGGKR
jgi:hypothetical protein